jgi:chromosome segregation ATPase
MEYKVTYEKKEYNLNAVLSFDLLKEILYKLLISQDNLEKEINEIKHSNNKRDKDIAKIEKYIKENAFDDEEFSGENYDSNASHHSNEEEYNYDDKQEKKTEEDLQPKEYESKEEKKQIEMTISPVINKNNETVKRFENDNKNVNTNVNDNDDNKNENEANTNIDDKDKDKNKDDKDKDDKDKDDKDKDNKDKDDKNKEINEDKDEKKVDKSSPKEEYRKIEKNTESPTTKTEKKQIIDRKKIPLHRINISNTNSNNQSNNNSNQIPPDLIRNMAKQIKDNKKRIVDLEKKLMKEIRNHSDSLKKDYHKMIKDHILENNSEFNNINTKIEELFRIKEDLESKMEDCITKCSTIDIYNMFKDSGDGTVDAAKVLVKALEEKVFKKLEFVDTRYKKDAVDNLKTKNNVDNLLPNFEKMKQNIEKIMENLEKNNEEADNNKREFDEQKNEIKNIIDDKNDILKNIENLKNDIDNIINTKLNDLDKKIEDLKKNSNDGTSELFKIGFGNQGIDEEMMQVMEKKISDLRKKTNDIENTMKLKNKDIEEIQNEVKDIKAILDKKITREDLKELYNLHLSDVDEINDLKDNAGMTFDEIRKTKNEITNILQKIDNINGNIVLLQNSHSSGSSAPIINFDKYVDQQKFTDTLKPILKEIEKIYREIESLIRNVDDYESKFNTLVKIDRVNRLEDDMSTKLNEYKAIFTKKFVDKAEFAKVMKQMEIQIKSLDGENKKSDGDSWLMAKQPVGCFNCASCEANIKNVNPSSEYISWNKYPHQDKIYRMGQGFSHMLQMMTSEFVKSIGNAEKDNGDESSSRSNNFNNLAINNNITFDKNLFNTENNERKQSASVLKINNKEQISEEVLKKINNYNLYSSKGKGKVQLPRVLKFKKKLKLKNDTANDIPVSDDDYTGRNHDSIDREFKDNNTSPKILKILKKKPFVKTEENLNYTQVNNTKC